MTEPRELTYLVPVDVLTEVQHAVAMLERHGPLVTEALRRLDRATTLAWQAVNLVQATDDEWRFVKHAIGIDRGWNAAYQLVLPSMCQARSRPPTHRLTARKRFSVQQVPWGRERPRSLPHGRERLPVCREQSLEAVTLGGWCASVLYTCALGSVGT